MKHAASIIARIYYLGGKATTKSRKPNIGDSISEFAKLGVKAEEEALTLYRQIIETSGKMGDWETRELFEKSTVKKKDTYSSFKNTPNSKTRKKSQARCLCLNGAKYTQTITSPS